MFTSILVAGETPAMRGGKTTAESYDSGRKFKGLLGTHVNTPTVLTFSAAHSQLVQQRSRRGGLSDALYELKAEIHDPRNG